MKYVFIGGCARSGTSAIWRILTANQTAVIGLERYIKLVNRPDEFNAGLFEERRFFDLRADETWYSDFSRFPYYAEARQRFKDAPIVGDKIPMLHGLLPQIKNNFQDAKIVYIVRNLFDVANSYQVRAEHHDDRMWALFRDYRKACTDWNASLEGLVEWTHKLPMAILDYESFFSGLAKIEALAGFLGLDAAAMRKAYEAELDKELPHKSPPVLDSLQRQYVAANGDFAAYSSALKLTQRWRYPGYAPLYRQVRPTRKYAVKDARVIDYSYVSIAGLPVRGPLPKASLKNAIASLGAASTFGRLVPRPFIGIVASQCGFEALNLGHGGARAPLYYMNRELMRKLNQCACAVVEVFSARGTGTAFAQSRDHASAFMRRRGTEDDFEFAQNYYRSLCSKLRPAELKSVLTGIQTNYMAEMNELLKQIEIPKVLVWFSQRSPDFEFSAEPDEFSGGYPHFVDRKMFDRLALACDASVEIVSVKGLPSDLLDRATGEPVEIFLDEDNPAQNTYYPSQEMHDELAAALVPVVRGMLGRRDSGIPRTEKRRQPAAEAVLRPGE